MADDDQIVRDLVCAVDAAAATFNGRNPQSGKLELRERELGIALEPALWALGRKPGREHSVRLEQAWCGRVGGVDLAFGKEGSPILVELKWDATSLAACAWDHVKLAASLHLGEGSRAFLIAGSPISNDLRGDELLDEAEVEPVTLRRHYAADFDRWKKQVKNHPSLAPAGWGTRCLHEATLEYKEEPWRIRLAELQLTRSELVPFCEGNAR